MSKGPKGQTESSKLPKLEKLEQQYNKVILDYNPKYGIKSMSPY